MGEWSPENTGGEWIEGQPGEVGSIFRGRNRGPHGEWETELTVVERVDDQAFSFRVAPPGTEGTTWRYTFETEGRGTRVSESFLWRWTPVPDEGFRGRVGSMPLPEARHAVSERERHLLRSADATMATLKAGLESGRRLLDDLVSREDHAESVARAMSWRCLG